jgi:antitoxin component YwqK of YwqJK toxin-antitoxin module
MKKEKIYSIVFVILTIMLFLTILILSEPKDDFKPLNIKPNLMKKNQRNKDDKRHGFWESYYSNGEVYYKGNYKNGEAHGYWEDSYYVQYNKTLIKEFHL